MILGRGFTGLLFRDCLKIGSNIYHLCIYTWETTDISPCQILVQTHKVEPSAPIQCCWLEFSYCKFVTIGSLVDPNSCFVL
jgi:hypothetical protein